jgi:hypothetical protein
VIYLTLPELLHVAERTPGADYAVRDYGLLEAALARPQATAFGKDAYPDLDAKAAALLRSVARNHALADGEPRPPRNPDQRSRSLGGPAAFTTGLKVGAHWRQTL